MTTDEIRIACAEEMGELNPPTCKPSIEQLEAILASKQSLKVQLMPNGEVRAMKDYPTDANAALELVETLVKDGWFLTVDRCTSGYDISVYQPMEHLKDSTIFHVRIASTLPLAICEAFLRVRGKWKEKDNK